MKNFNEVEMENVPIRKRKMFHSKKEKYSNQKKENIPMSYRNIPMRKIKIVQSENGKYFNQRK